MQLNVQRGYKKRILKLTIELIREAHNWFMQQAHSPPHRIVRKYNWKSFTILTASLSIPARNRPAPTTFVSMNLLIRPAPNPIPNNTLNCDIRRPRQPSSGAKIRNIGIPLLPALPIVHGDSPATDGVQKVLTPVGLGVALELESVASESAIGPASITLEHLGAGDEGWSVKEVG